MWQHDFEARTDLPVEALWPVLADVAGWPAIDRNIRRLTLDGPPGLGTPFVLQPVGGPPLRFTIDRFDAPHAYADTCHLLGARMTTEHRLLAAAEGGTRIVVAIRIRGPLAWLWGRLVGRTHAAGLPAQTDRFVAAARARRA